MYTVSLMRDGKEILCPCKDEATAFVVAYTYWHLDPIVHDPAGNVVRFD